ncbi:hypothetical protein QMO56_02705 [Roseomonas sp. E05]|uniref:ArnT family glycosyltransferase n=1 Tax=Roseomonas sp. E05 TaxID=3046310 RepID=UPI0024BA7322|nr:hypothetical protein [Roseomonas sp. E05]MDJ0387012.1 hypothetical protein [Roseomonas sp. E05]
MPEEAGKLPRRAAPKPWRTGARLGVRWWLGALACLLAAALVLRIPAFFPVGLTPDEGLYMVQAREWLRGGWPYVAVWDMHPLGAPALFAATFALLGESLFSIRLLGVFSVTATALALILAVRAAGGSRGTGFAAGLIYGGHSLLLNGSPTNTEILFAPFVTLGMAAALRSCRRLLQGGAPPGWQDMLLIGLPIGLALVIKSIVVMEGSAAFLLVVGVAWRCGALSVPRLLGLALCYAVICATPTLLAGLPYLLRGELAAYVHANFVAPAHYLSDGASRSEALRQTALALLGCAWVFALGAVALLTLTWKTSRERRPVAAWLLVLAGLLWFAAATLGVIAPRKFYDHYFLTWLPPLALLGAVGARQLARSLQPAPATLAFAVVVLTATLSPWSSGLAERVRTGFGLRNPVVEVAKSVAAAIRPGDPIYVVNEDPIIYILAQAAVPTPYVFAEHLADQTDSRLGEESNPAMIDQDAEVARILGERPRAIVLHRGRWAFLRPRSAALIAEALANDYVQAGMVEAAGGTVEIWRRR